MGTANVNEDRLRFLQFVRDYVAQDPECGPLVAHAASSGISDALKENRQMVVDMETALAISLAKRYKGADILIREKLSKWEGKTALNWSSLYKERSGQSE